MYSKYHDHSYCYEKRGPSRGPEIYYGYCHETRRMRMMDYDDYMRNLQTGLSNLYRSVQEPMQVYMRAMSYAYGRPERPERCYEERTRWKRERRECEEHRDCHCYCCIRCADVVEYAHCGEVRMIPITLENDTRRERDIKLQLGAFATADGKELGWDTSFSEAEFKLPPCGEKTVLLRVVVDCSKFGGTAPPGTTANVPPAPASVSECKVVYGTVRAEGCLIRALVVAVPVLPDDCSSHRAGCGCGCCC